MLNENIELHRDLVEHLPDGVILHRQRRILFANQAAAHICGAPSTAYLEGKDILEIVHPDHRDAVIEAMRQTVLDSPAGFLEQKLVRFDGVAIWVDVRVTATTLDGERTAIVVMRDATQRRQASEELRKAKDQLEDAIESMADSFALWGPDDRLIAFNEPFRRYCGAAQGVLTPGIAFEDFLRAFIVRNRRCPPEEVEERIKRRLVQHSTPGGRFEIVGPGGEVHQVVDRATRDGGIVSISIDITDIRRAEQALRESEALHRLLFDAAPYGIIVVQDGRVVLANPTAARARGFARPEEFIGQSPFVRIHPDDAREVAERARTVLRGDLGGSIPAQYRVLHPDGAVAHMDSAATKFEFRSRPAILIHQNDVTEQVKAREENQALEAQLRRAEKMKSVGTLAEGIAHEFNNLLVPIIGLTELAIDSLPDGDATAAMLNQVLSAAQRSRELIKRIRAFGHSERASDTLQTVLVQDLLGATVGLVRPSIPAGIRINYRADPSCGPVAIQDGQLERILVDLCSNAGDAIGVGTGEISIELRPAHLGNPRAAALQALRQGDYVVLSVRDTGCGMDAATMERIFDPFFTTKEVGRGTGLGLAVIHGLISACGGGITVASELGKGSEFCVYLPVISVQSETPYVAAQAIG